MWAAVVPGRREVIDRGEVTKRHKLKKKKRKKEDHEKESIKQQKKDQQPTSSNYQPNDSSCRMAVEDGQR